jgi:hypothetical protein
VGFVVDKVELGRVGLHPPLSEFKIKKIYYATSRKAAGSSPDEVIGFLSIDLILPAFQSCLDFHVTAV